MPPLVSGLDLLLLLFLFNLHSYQNHIRHSTKSLLVFVLESCRSFIPSQNPVSEIWVSQCCPLLAVSWTVSPFFGVSHLQVQRSSWGRQSRLLPWHTCDQTQKDNSSRWHWLIILTVVFKEQTFCNKVVIKCLLVDSFTCRLSCPGSASSTARGSLLESSSIQSHLHTPALTSTVLKQGTKRAAAKKPKATVLDSGSILTELESEDEFSCGWVGFYYHNICSVHHVCVRLLGVTVGRLPKAAIWFQ